MFRTYDHWKSTNPADEFLGPEPEADEDAEAEPAYPTLGDAELAFDSAIPPHILAGIRGRERALAELPRADLLARLIATQRARVAQDRRIALAALANRRAEWRALWDAPTPKPSRAWNTAQWRFGNIDRAARRDVAFWQAGRALLRQFERELEEAV